MESFVLSETLKVCDLLVPPTHLLSRHFILQYLYLLFDEENPLHSDDSNFVLTTEGHLLTMSKDLQRPMSPIRRKLRRVEHPQCPAYQSSVLAYDPSSKSILTAGIYSRTDIEYARSLVAAPSTDEETYAWSPNGWCAVPRVDLYVSPLRSYFRHHAHSLF